MARSNDTRAPACRTRGPQRRTRPTLRGRKSRVRLCNQRCCKSRAGGLIRHWQDSDRCPIGRCRAVCTSPLTLRPRPCLGMVIWRSPVRGLFGAVRAGPAHKGRTSRRSRPSTTRPSGPASERGERSGTDRLLRLATHSSTLSDHDLVGTSSTARPIRPPARGCRRHQRRAGDQSGSNATHQPGIASMRRGVPSTRG